MNTRVNDNHEVYSRKISSLVKNTRCLFETALNVFVKQSIAFNLVQLHVQDSTDWLRK